MVRVNILLLPYFTWNFLLWAGAAKFRLLQSSGKTLRSFKFKLVTLPICRGLPAAMIFVFPALIINRLLPILFIFCKISSSVPLLTATTTITDETPITIPRTARPE